MYRVQAISLGLFGTYNLMENSAYSRMPENGSVVDTISGFRILKGLLKRDLDDYDIKPDDVPTYSTNGIVVSVEEIELE